jgi:hypothetical protein
MFFSPLDLSHWYLSKQRKFLKGREEALVSGPKEPPPKTCKFLKG